MFIRLIVTLCLVLLVQPARAGTLFAPVADLTAPPDNNVCSQCGASGQNAGERVTFATSVTIQSFFLVVNPSWYFPASITLSVFTDAATYPDTNAPGTVGAALFQSTYTPDAFASLTNTPNGTAVVGINTGALTLAAGTYDFFFANTGDLNLEMWFNLGGNAFFSLTTPGSAPAAGDGYYVLPYDIGVSLSGDPIPEPAGLWLMCVAVGSLLLARRTMRLPRQV